MISRWSRKWLLGGYEKSSHIYYSLTRVPGQGRHVKLVYFWSGRRNSRKSSLALYVIGDKNNNGLLMQDCALQVNHGRWVNRIKSEQYTFYDVLIECHISPKGKSSLKSTIRKFIFCTILYQIGDKRRSCLCTQYCTWQALFWLMVDLTGELIKGVFIYLLNATHHLE